MSLEEYVKEKLWPVFVEAVHSLVMFHNHKTYTRDRILPEKPEITPMELASRLNVSLGEALLILYELKEESKSTP